MNPSGPPYSTGQQSHAAGYTPNQAHPSQDGPGERYHSRPTPMGSQHLQVQPPYPSQTDPYARNDQQQYHQPPPFNNAQPHLATHGAVTQGEHYSASSGLPHRSAMPVPHGYPLARPYQHGLQPPSHAPQPLVQAGHTHFIPTPAELARLSANYLDPRHGGYTPHNRDAAASGSQPAPQATTQQVPERHFCEICGVSFARSADKRRHIETLHLPTAAVHRCQWCDKGFNRKDSLKRHIDNGCEMMPTST